MQIFPTNISLGEFHIWMGFYFFYFILSIHVKREKKTETHANISNQRRRKT